MAKRDPEIRSLGRVEDTFFSTPPPATKELKVDHPASL